MTDSPAHAAPRHAASPRAGSFQARPRRRVGRGVVTPLPSPLLGLALTHAVRLVDRRSADILFFHQMGRTQPRIHNPKIDRGDGV